MNSGNLATSSSTCSRVIVRLLVGHSSEKLSHTTPKGHTHRWTVYVRPTGSVQFTDRSFIRKVVFILHSSFNNPNRVVKEPPFQLTETGYGGFEMQIKIQFNGVNKTFTFNYDLSLSLVDKYCEFNTEQKMELRDVKPELYNLVKKYCLKKQDKEVSKEKLLFTKNQFAIKNERVKNDFNLIPKKSITNNISNDETIKNKNSLSNDKKTEKVSKKSQACESSLSTKLIMPTNSEKSIKSSKHTNLFDTSNKSKSSDKNLNNLKSSKSSSNIIHSNKTELKSVKNEISTNQKSDEKLKIKKKKIEDDFMNSFFDEPKKVDNNLKEKKRIEKSKIKYKNSVELIKEEKLTEKKEIKKIDTIKQFEQFDSKKNIETNKNATDSESVDINKKSKKNVDEFAKKKLIDPLLPDKIVKEKKLKSSKIEAKNLVEKTDKVLVEKKSDFELNEQNLKRESKQLDLTDLKQDNLKQKKTKLLNECTKTEPNLLSYRNVDNCEKRPHSSISLMPPSNTGFINQSSCSINSTPARSVSPLNAQRYAASSTCSENTEMSLKEENITNNIRFFVNENSIDNHETNNNNNNNNDDDDDDEEPENLFTKNFDIDYNSDDEEIFGSPYEKIRRYNFLQERINSILLAEDELQYRILDTLMTMENNIIDYDETLNDVKFKLRFLKRETVLALEEIFHNFEPINNWMNR